jgi:hypothetical protein
MNEKSKDNWFKLSSLILTTVVALIGLYFNNYFASQRDFNNKLRDIRLNYLVDVYRKLSDSSQRIPNDKYFPKMETVISDMQLFGTKSQIGMTIQFMNEYENKGQGNLDPLLNDLRDNLRKELKLESISQNVHWFRHEGVPDINKVDIKKYLETLSDKNKK